MSSTEQQPGAGAPPPAETGADAIAPPTINGSAHVTAAPEAAENGAAVGSDIIVGPLINYKRLSNELTDNPTWHGSVLVVTKRGQEQPELSLAPSVGSPEVPVRIGLAGARRFPGEKLYEDRHGAFWRFTIDVPVQDEEAKWEYTIAPFVSLEPKQFFVPAKTESFRIMFHSCNGFSVGTDEDEWSGPALWNDVLRKHKEQPFHVMIGGGDQIYNDNVRVTGPLKEWTDISNPRKRREYPFNEDLRQRSDDHYFNNYVKWYGMEPFKGANASIPQLNIWDDHDIIDGFGSYTDHFMRCHVFRGIGGVAHKFYLLFQHHLAPPKDSFVTPAAEALEEGVKTDNKAPEDVFVLNETTVDPMYIIGNKPGPYVQEPSRSIITQLGARVAFVGIDARQERTRHQINYPETYNLIFERLDQQFTNNPNLQHLILLLGVPIAYPRLQWLENIFNSPIIGPIRFLNKRFGLAGGLFNKFDGQVDLLDDLDDHYTARTHKRERRDLIQRLQAFSKKHSARVTILGGDVHLAAIGRFYSKPGLKIPAERDWRYMPNIISSAITNKPPPAAVANLLARRNKIHHLDHETDETLLEFFDHDPGHAPGSVEQRKQEGGNEPNKKTMDSNHATMPSRNYAIICESRTTAGPSPAATTDVNGTNGTNGTNGVNGVSEPPAEVKTKPNMRRAIHEGEKNSGTSHPAVAGRSGLGGEHGLDVTIRVEINNRDRTGQTEGYGFSIPGLDCKGYSQEGAKW